MRYSSAIAALGVAFATSLASAQSTPSTTIVEFYLAPFNKYYLSAVPNEWAGLDASAQLGWHRTGVTHTAASATDLGAKPVCRFFHPGVATHFFTVIASECAVLATLPDFVNEGIGWYAKETTNGACPAGTAPLYRTFNNGVNANNGPANHRYFSDYSFYQTYAAKGYALEGLTMCLPQSSAEKRADAARLLYQASFGARPADIDVVVNKGTTAWIDEQLALPASRYTARDWMPLSRPESCVNSSTPPLTANSYCQRDNYGLFQVQREFFQQAFNNPDQLKQRLAWAWSQFFVVSGVEVSMAYAMIDYQQLLRDNAVGNFRTLIEKVTLHGSMGRMLDMVNNLKPDSQRGIAPNENYARELLQLFTLGLYQLNDDGSYKRGANGIALDTYTQDDVENLAHVLTGWTYATVPGQQPRDLNRMPNKGAMEERSQHHDFSARTLLGQTIAGNLTQTQRLARALDIIANHPNAAPFVSKFLIQQLVAGDPSPSYISRVAEVFKNNGSGIRGDMKAVVRAILTDVEARGATKWSPNYGHQSEPVLLLTRLARASGAQSDGVFFRDLATSAGQNVFFAPSVFNYYPPDNALASNGVLAPEFAIYNTASALNRANMLYAVLYSNITPSPQVLGATGTQFDLTGYAALAATPDALIDRINEVLVAGRLSAASKAAIRVALDSVPSTDALARVRLAMHLASSAPDSQVLR